MCGNLDPDEGEEEEIVKIAVMVTGFYCTTRKSRDDTCPKVCVLPVSLLVPPAIFSAGQNSRCVKSVAKLVPQRVKDEEDFWTVLFFWSTQAHN